MASLDIDKLAEPIPGDSPCGRDLRTWKDGAEFYELKSRFNAAKRGERDASWDDSSHQTPAPDWSGIAAEIEQRLATETKDLQLVGWLIECRARTGGAAGIATGFALARRLIANHWDHLYPLLDDDGVEGRIRGLVGLGIPNEVGQVSLSLDEILIANGDAGPLTYADVRRAKAHENAPGGPAADITMADVRASVHGTPAEHFQRLRDDVERCEQEVRGLLTELDELCGEGPVISLHHLVDAFAELARTVRGLAADKLREADHVPETEPSMIPPRAAGTAPTTGQVASPSATIEGREQAFQVILNVASFFRRTEPHSFVSYALERVVQWGRTPLPELVEQLESQGSLKDFFRTVGVIPSPGMSSSSSPHAPRAEARESRPASSAWSPPPEANEPDDIPNTTAGAIAKFTKNQ